MEDNFECVRYNEGLCGGPVTWVSGHWAEKGSGGFAMVYGVDGVDGLPGDHDYAIKWYNKRDIDRDAVEREYDTLRLLGGAGGHAPKAYALGRTWHDGARRWAIVMDLMGGSTLKEAYDSLCEDGEVTLDARRALAALGQVARACEACRDRGVNRDLQPRNVMVEVDPERREVTHAAIVDWGQAPESPTKDTFAKAATLPFAAPEMFGGKYRRAPWRNAATVDVWSLGALGFWLRTREVPLKDELEGVDGFKDGANEGRAEIKRGGIDLGFWLEEHGIRSSPLDEELSDLIAECTRFDPDERPQTPGEVADRIDGILEDLAESLLGQCDAPPLLVPDPVDKKQFIDLKKRAIDLQVKADGICMDLHETRMDTLQTRMDTLQMKIEKLEHVVQLNPWQKYIKPFIWGVIETVIWFELAYLVRVQIIDRFFSFIPRDIKGWSSFLISFIVLCSLEVHFSDDLDEFLNMDPAALDGLIYVGTVCVSVAFSVAMVLGLIPSLWW